MFGILAGLSLVSLLLISGMGLLISQIPVALGIVNVVGIAVLVILAAISVRAGLGLLRAPVASNQMTTLSAKDKPFHLLPYDERHKPEGYDLLSRVFPTVSRRS